jgi:hypothetical protein
MSVVKLRRLPMCIISDVSESAVYVIFLQGLATNFECPMRLIL